MGKHLPPFVAKLGFLRLIILLAFCSQKWSETCRRQYWC